jgi:hypothetical protein
MKVKQESCRVKQESLTRMTRSQVNSLSSSHNTVIKMVEEDVSAKVEHFDCSTSQSIASSQKIK